MQMINYNYKSQLKVIAVTGGKGGTGKTNVAINLASMLGSYKQNVILLDADFGLANVDMLLGFSPQKTLSDVIAGSASLDEVLVRGPNNIRILPSSRGNSQMANLSLQHISGLIHGMSDLEVPPNILIIDTAAGIQDAVIGLAIAATEILVVVCNDPASIADAYALIKLLHTRYKVNKFRILTNKVASKEESYELFAKLTKVVDKFLTASLDNAGFIPYDKMLEKAVRKQQAVIEAYPHSKSGISFGHLAKSVLNWPLRYEHSGGLSFDMEIAGN